MKNSGSHPNKSIKKSGLIRFVYAFNGMKKAWTMESSFRIQSFCAFALLVFCLIVRPSIFWCVIFLGFTSLVLALEMLNTALEALLDKLHPDQHPQVGYIKDCAAGAVLIASVGALIAFILFVYTKMT